VRGLVINTSTSGSGIEINTARGNTIAGNFIGTDPTGTIHRPLNIAIRVLAGNNTIGGTASTDRNLLNGAQGITNGTLTLNANGSFAYTPNAGFSGTDTFIYKVSDGAADSNTATVTITVNPSNDLPVANDDAYALTKGNTLSVPAASGVFANDSDPNGDRLTARLVTGPSMGTLTLNPDGSFAYTKPKKGFQGVTFVYEASDGSGGTDRATVTIRSKGR
jgi:VCBS repeat-containing protein